MEGHLPMEVHIPDGKTVTVLSVREKLKRIGMDEDEIEYFMEKERCPLCTKKLDLNVNDEGTVGHLKRCFELRKSIRG